MISLIATVLNEAESLRRLFESLRAQTRFPDEIVMVDGGSTDATRTLLEHYVTQFPLRVLVEPGCNISQGRNRAIAAAQGDLIVVMDAGVRLHPTWLDAITRPLREDAAVQWVGGFFQADMTTPFEVAMSATVLPLVDEISPATFLPSSRSVAFRKSAWERVEGYPEWLDYCEDLIFDLRLKQAYPQPGTFVFAPEALVDFRPRGTLRSFYKQYYYYARGDGKADLWRKRHAIRYGTYGIAAPLLLLLASLVHPLWWLVLLVGAVVYLRQPFQRLHKLLPQADPHLQPRTFPQRLRLWAWLPVIRVVGDVAKMMGYPVGWRWRLQHRPPTKIGS
jgi:glycosyltransferase involved in cell wall biosynthesis